MPKTQKIIILTCIFLFISAYKLKCPHKSQRKPRILSVCNGNAKEYTCLYDTSKDSYVEFCSTKNDYVRSGLKYVRSGTFRNIPCSDGRFQPFRFWSNKDTDCLFTKTTCDGIGQVIHDNTSTQTDVTCRCDYRGGYTFVVQPSNLCFCNPSKEDCSCYIKQCPDNSTLSPDYECISLNVANRIYICQPISYSKMNSTDNGMAIGIIGEIMQYGLRMKSELIILTVPVIVFAVIAVTFLIICPVPGTSSQYDNRQQTLSLESTSETSSQQETNRTKVEIKKYKMESTPRGFVLIINNIHFHNHKHRPGAQQDRNKLKALFEDFGFQVDVKEDKTAMQIEELLSEFSSLEALYHVDSLIVALMSHGDNEFILGSDCYRLNVIGLIQKFNANSCPAMNGKPKMFIVNACRGDVVDSDAPLGSTRPCSDMIETESSVISLDRKQPANSDFVIAYSTFPGNVSFRDVEQGSWFIQCLEEVFRESASDEHVMDMLTQVNNKLAGMSESMMGYNQTPAPTTTLRYKWYLNPQTV